MKLRSLSEKEVNLRLKVPMQSSKVKVKVIGKCYQEQGQSLKVMVNVTNNKVKV